IHSIIAIAEINEALNSGDHQQTLAALLLPTAKLTGVNPAIAKHYHDTLHHIKQLLCQVCHNHHHQYIFLFFVIFL
uniref:Uncharacterized protein n=1 Tax=Cyprinodon variegatus TaxID=28743 RepID=A0A3Q2G637_CYPVA